MDITNSYLEHLREKVKGQKRAIIDKLLRDGYVSRNWALMNYISRLSAIIYSLKNMGLSITARQKNKDYYYSLDF